MAEAKENNLSYDETYPEFFKQFRKEVIANNITSSSSACTLTEKEILLKMQEEMIDVLQKQCDELRQDQQEISKTFTLLKEDHGLIARLLAGKLVINKLLNGTQNSYADIRLQLSMSNGNGNLISEQAGAQEEKNPVENLGDVVPVNMAGVTETLFHNNSIATTNTAVNGVTPGQQAQSTQGTKP